jgi:uncharacterized protein YjbI with pentapeptide repeats
VARQDEVDRARGRPAPGSRPPRGPLETVAASDVGVDDSREAEEIVGEHLARVDWSRVSLRGCQVHLVDVAELVADRARLINSRLREPDIAQVSAPDSTWRAVVVGGGRLGAWDLAGAVLDAVTVADAQLGYVNLRDATLTDVVLRDCRIEVLDLAGAVARRVSLAGCAIGELVVVHATVDELDLRGARVDSVDGVENLAGAIISAEQLLDLAPALAQAAGITIGPWLV